LKGRDSPMLVASYQSPVDSNTIDKSENTEENNHVKNTPLNKSRDSPRTKSRKLSSRTNFSNENIFNVSTRNFKQKENNTIDNNGVKDEESQTKNIVFQNLTNPRSKLLKNMNRIVEEGFKGCKAFPSIQSRRIIMRTSLNLEKLKSSYINPPEDNVEPSTFRKYTGSRQINFPAQNKAGKKGLPQREFKLENLKTIETNGHKSPTPHLLNYSEKKNTQKTDSELPKFFSSSHLKSHSLIKNPTKRELFLSGLSPRSNQISQSNMKISQPAETLIDQKEMTCFLEENGLEPWSVHLSDDENHIFI
jgi:hypothetical protein